ncbi:Signal transduction histidine kinase [Meinhardsimonia xiamenensis]|jgi:signal transduction histidine kinase|uniref:histidine kinase n=1 Tax=Meinhardsimonia xiamenensis TaxID=990712 RepID=A0A1G9ECA6_9RHOB|nr:HAMP domain-containing sensor histidine kinase [Meinhardsimonia xiamenensis]PRX33833.1 signal transduction histidine kinase [Meinhardsimonia xiamenensis]SDK73800.1 Signal transduction histidine kinase [Meinhardsimonia xiamenensis]
MFLNTLSGRFLILTVVFVMLAEVLIFVPSVARFRQDYLVARLERAQIAALAVLADDMIDETLERELLSTAGVYNVVLVRDQSRQLMLSSPIPSPVDATYDMRDPGPLELIVDAFACLMSPGDKVIRVIGAPVRHAGQLIEVTMPAAPLRAAMIEYGLRILVLSAVISIITAFFLFLAVRRVLVRPIARVVEAMTRYAEAPEDARRIIEPSASVVELRQAEEALRALQTQLTAALRQKRRLAQLGEAVAKVSHDLRNMLTTAQLLADRIERSADPSVARAAPKLVGSISRAVSLCESTLAFGRAEEPPPSLQRLSLAQLVSEVIDSEALAMSDGARVSFIDDVPAGMQIRADPEQLYRVLDNLVRNARQAIEAAGVPGEVRISAREDEREWIISVSDTGPGLPERARDKLFTPFEGGTRKDGTGLGLAIAMELVRGHGGRLELAETGPGGTTFVIRLPKSIVALEAAAE